MSIPTRHHFLPEFYLRRWATPKLDGKLVGFKRPHKVVTAMTFFPAAIAYERHLYAVPSRADPAARQALESRFMSPLDARAAEALAFLEQERRRPDDSRLASAWSRFIMSQLYRSPERIAWLKGQIRARKADARDELKAAWAVMRGADDPESFDDYMGADSGALYEEAAALLLRNMIDNQRIGAHLNNMLWFLVEAPEGGHGVLTGDSPVLISNGLGAPDGFLMMPASRTTVFLAANRQAVAESFFVQNPKAFFRAVNDAVVRQADRLVIGHSKRHLAFVEKRLGHGGPSSAVGLFQRMTWKAPLAQAG